MRTHLFRSPDEFRARTTHYDLSPRMTIMVSSLSALEGSCANFFQRDADPGKAFGGDRVAALHHEIELFVKGVFNYVPEGPDRTLVFRHIEMAKMIGTEILYRHLANEKQGDRRTTSLMVLDTLIGEYRAELLRARLRANQAISLSSPAAQDAFASLAAKDSAIDA